MWNIFKGSSDNSEPESNWFKDKWGKYSEYDEFTSDEILDYIRDISTIGGFRMLHQSAINAFTRSVIALTDKTAALERRIGDLESKIVELNQSIDFLHRSRR